MHMAAQTDFYEDRLHVFLEKLQEAAVAERIELDGFLHCPCGYKQGNALPEIDGRFAPFDKYARWGGEKDGHAWFYKKLEIPARLRGQNLELRVETQIDGWDAVNPQFIVYLDGVLVQGLDTNHRDIFLDNAKAEYELYIYGYVGSLFARHLEFNATLYRYHDVLRKLYYRLAVPYEITQYLEPNEKTYTDVKTILERALPLIDLREPGSDACLASAEKAIAYLEEAFSDKASTGVTALCIGHTHIDVAWLWTLAQTREKVLRSFSTVLTLMRRYPAYKFMSSQAQLYKFLKEESPELYAEVREMVRQGRWEVEGGTYELRVSASVSDIRLTATVTVAGTGAPNPYEGADVTPYEQADVLSVDDAHFAALLGHAIPDGQTQVDRNICFRDLNRGRSLIFLLVWAVLRAIKNAADRSGHPNLNVLFIWNMPLRAIAKMTGGMVDMAVVDALVREVKGFGWGGVIRLALSLALGWGGGMGILLWVLWIAAPIVFALVMNLIQNASLAKKIEAASRRR